MHDVVPGVGQEVTGAAFQLTLPPLVTLLVPEAKDVGDRSQPRDEEPLAVSPGRRVRWLAHGGDRTLMDRIAGLRAGALRGKMAGELAALRIAGVAQQIVGIDGHQASPARPAVEGKLIEPETSSIR